MPRDAEPSRGVQPVLRVDRDGPGPLLRAAVVVGIVAGAAAASGASAASAACAAAAAGAAVACDGVLAGRRRRRLGGAAGAALHHEHARDAVARMLSLELAHERSSAVIEALCEGVLVVDGGGEIVLANEAARRAMRHPHRDPSGWLLWDALAPELASRAHDAWLALRGGSAAPSELPQVRYSAIPCGDRVYDLTAVEAMSPRTGEDFGSVFLLVDSTRAHELQRLKDRFLSSVSHELRTPLTNICAYAEILRHLLPGESSEWPEFVQIIHEEGVQLSGLVDAMFDYLQLESGEAVFASEPMDGAAVVREVVAEFDAVARRRGIDVALVEAAEPPALQGDGQRWRQVVRHLLDNAIKFTPRGGRVRVVVGASEHGFELRIEDSGPGVPPGDRQAVFEKFHQLRDHLTDKLPGTGLGLATSRAIVARLGGLIWCEDSSLGGAAFVVLLPGTAQPRLAAVGAGTGAGGGF